MLCHVVLRPTPNWGEVLVMCAGVCSVRVWGCEGVDYIETRVMWCGVRRYVGEWLVME